MLYYSRSSRSQEYIDLNRANVVEELKLSSPRSRVGLSESTRFLRTDFALKTYHTGVKAIVLFRTPSIS